MNVLHLTEKRYLAIKNAKLIIIAEIDQNDNIVALK